MLRLDDVWLNYGSFRALIGVSLNYFAVLALAETMKLAGTVIDAKAIRGQFDETVKALPVEYNPSDASGVDARGGIAADPQVAVVEGGKVREVKLSKVK